MSLHRRSFVGRTLAAGTLAGLGDFSFLNQLPQVSADEVKAVGKVKVGADIEPLVRLMEESPREKVLEAVAGRIKDGASYEQLLTALLLAGVRGIRPRPVGFKFHAVLVVNSAHLAALAAPDTDRWLPLFWAVDNYKVSQARNAQEGNWVMPPVAEGKLPASHEAKQRFITAMDNWDEEGADQAIAAWSRGAGATEVIETFWRYGARDFRDIGHKAIYVANAWRTLQTIGWRHAEPVLRSLAYALLEHEGDNPAQRDADADRPGRDNLRRAVRIRNDWRDGKIDPKATTALLATLRTAKPGDASDAVVDMLNKEVAPASVWDALFLFAGELLMSQPGIVGLHTVTTANALHYGYQTSGNDETRRYLMLQCAAFLPMFRDAMAKRGKVRAVEIDTLEKEEVKADGLAAIEEIFASVPKDRDAAARKVLGLAGAHKLAPEALMTAARRLIFLKGFDAHDYKFSSAALEDYYHVTPAWRDRFLATSMFNLKGAGDRDNDLVQRTRAALKA